MACFIGNKEVSCEEWDAARKSRYKDSVKVQTGKSTTGLNVVGQQGSQYWLNTDYAGAEPSKEVKAAVSTADYARDWIGEYSRNTVKAANAGTIRQVSAAVANKAVTYPEPSASVRQLWQDYPAIAPTGQPAAVAGANVGPGATPRSVLGKFPTVSDIVGGGGSGAGAAGSTDTGAGDTSTLLLLAGAAVVALAFLGRPSRSRA